jgi:hypothetical protein
MLPADGSRSPICARFKSDLMMSLRGVSNIAAVWPLVFRIAERTVSPLYRVPPNIRDWFCD